MESKYLKYKTKLLGLKAAKLRIQTYLQIGGSSGVEAQSDRIKNLIATLKSKSAEITTKLDTSTEIHKNNKEAIEKLLDTQLDIEKKLQEKINTLENKNTIYHDYNSTLINNLKELNGKLDEYKLEKTTLENAKNKINVLVTELIQNSSASSRDIEELKEKHEREITGLENEIREILDKLGQTSDSVHNTSAELLQKKPVSTGGRKKWGGAEEEKTGEPLNTQQKLEQQLQIMTQYIDQLEGKIDSIKSPYANDDNTTVMKFKDESMYIDDKLKQIDGDLNRIKEEHDELGEIYANRLKDIIEEGVQKLNVIQSTFLREDSSEGTLLGDGSDDEQPLQEPAQGEGEQQQQQQGEQQQAQGEQQPVQEQQQGEQQQQQGEQQQQQGEQQPVQEQQQQQQQQQQPVQEQQQTNLGGRKKLNSITDLSDLSVTSIDY
jgi:hypothetical protein